MNRTKLKALFGVLIALFLMTAFSVFANAAVVELPEYPMSYTGSENAATVLDNAMKKAEEGYNVTLTLTADMVFNPSSATTYPLGTDKTTDGVVTITSTNGSGIVLTNNTRLHFKGNVAFESVRLEKTYNTVGIYGGSFIMVTEGKGRFGKADGTGAITNGLVGNYAAETEKRKVRIAVMGTDLEVYSGEYVAVCANFQASGLVIEDADIVFGGTAMTEILAGRAIYSGEGSGKKGAVTGTTKLTIQDSAVVTSSVTAGSYKIKTAYPGDATLIMNGGTVKHIGVLFYDTYYPTVGGNLSYVKENDTRSLYTVEINGGTVNGNITLGNNRHNGDVSGRRFNVKGFDVAATIGEATISGSLLGGFEFTGEVGNMTMDEASLVMNFANAAISKDFYGGSKISTTAEDSPVIDNITRTFNIDATTFGASVIFGSYLNAPLSEHRGNITVNVPNTNTGAVAFSGKTFYGGSHLTADGAIHSGDIDINIVCTSNAMITLGQSTRYMGCAVSASNTTVSGNVTAEIDTGTNYDWWIGTKTIPAIASSYVETGLSGVTISGGSDITLKHIKLSRAAYGGSVLNSPVNHTQPVLEESDTDKYKTKLTLVDVCTYVEYSWDPVEFQICGGDLINHSGVVNRANSEIVVESLRASSNPNVMFFGGSNLAVANAKNYADSKITVKGKAIDSTKKVYAGSYLNGENTLHSGDSCLDLIKGWATVACPKAFGGSLLAKTGATHSGDSSILIKYDSPVSGSVVYGGSHLYAAGTTHSGKSNITLSGGVTYIQKNAFGGSLIEGYEAGKKSVHRGDSSVVIKDGITTAADFMIFGGSEIVSQNGEQSGNSSITVESGYASSAQSIRNKGGLYGGSYLNATEAKHSGTSLLSIKSTNFTADCSKIYGGSYIARSGASQTGDSKLGLYAGEHTLFTALYGGSNFADYDAVDNGDSATKTFGHLAGSAVELNGANVNNAAAVIYGGSNMNYETASIQNGLAVHGTANSLTYVLVMRKSGTMNYKSVFAGSNIGSNKGFMYGAHELYIDGTQTFNSVIAAAELLNAESKLYGNTLLYFGKNSSYTQINKGTANIAIAAGIYGNGQMEGNSELRIAKTAWLQEFGSFVSNSKTNVKVITAGCYGTNDIDSTDVTLATTGAAPIYGGIRQKGNVKLVIDNAEGGIRTPIVVSGFRSNVGKLNGQGGNVDVEITGTITIRYQFQVLGYGCAASDFERYSSCEGNISVILDGAILGDGNNAHSFVCGGMNYGGDKSGGGTHMRAGFNVCKGDTYIEITDKVQFNTTKIFTIITSGQYTSEGTTYLKVVGDLQLPTDTVLKMAPGGDAFKIASTGGRYIDFTQVTGTAPAYTVGGKAATVYASMHEQAITFSVFDPSTVTVLKDLSGNTLTWNGCSATYEALTAFDSYAKNKNGLLFYDVAADKVLKNGISANTGTSLKIQCGTVYSAEFEITDALNQSILEMIKSDYEIIGTSLRVGNLAMRCRAKISKEFFDNYKVMNSEKGFRIARLGIIVGVTDGEYSYDLATGKTTNGTIDAWIWADGSINPEAGKQSFKDDPKHPGYYLYAAAVTGYMTNGLLNDRSQRNVYFRSYIVFEDANGVQTVVYLDNPTDENNPQTNYAKSLHYTAQQVKDKETDWYNSTSERKATVDMILEGPVTQYNITMTKGNEMGSLSAEYVEKTENYTKYKISVTPKAGYVVSAFTINGVGHRVHDGSYTYCEMTEDAEVEVTYARKETDELTSRRNAVIAKAKGMFDVRFFYTSSYDFTYSSNYNSQHISAFSTMNGIPYSSAPTITTASFIRDFVNYVNDDGAYVPKNIIATTVSDVIDGEAINANYAWGSNCADYVYEAWSEVCSSVDFATTSRFNENYGAIPVGYYVVDPSSFTSGGSFVSQIGKNPTKDVCNANGKDVMFAAYRMLKPGDAGLTYNDGHGHALLVESIEIVYADDGKIDGAKSRINFYEQNVGGCNHCTSNNITWNTFDWFFNDGYLPYTCKELLDDNYEVAESTYNDSVAASDLDSIDDVTAGKITSNYYVDRLEMVITNKATGTEQIFIRYMDEKQVRGFDLNEFTYDYLPQYKTLHVYAGNVYNPDELTTGDYNCKVTLTLMNGDEYTVRNFDFTK